MSAKFTLGQKVRCNNIYGESYLHGCEGFVISNENLEKHGYVIVKFPDQITGAIAPDMYAMTEEELDAI